VAEGAAAPESADRVAQILAESARLFATTGYKGTSMRDIAAACGISKSLLYHHFTDKDDIYARIALSTTRDLHAFVLARIPQGAPAVEQVRAYMLATADFFQHPRWAWLAAAATWHDPEPHRQQERMLWRDRYETLLRDLLAEAQAQGALREVDIPLAGRLILSALNWMHRWYRPEKGLSAPQVAEAYFDMILKGLRK
jgi:TetR/AcrR family transcriptional regulator, cholesterol catabolism regulator